MKRILFRLSATLLALLLGGVLVYSLTQVGNETRGPITTLLDKTSAVVENIEQKNIIEVREDRRIDKLDWLKPYRNNLNLLKNPNKILLGATDNHTKQGFEGILNLEDSIQTSFAFMHIYSAWGDKWNQSFPEKQVQSILTTGSIPVITWEPWLSDFDSKTHPNLKPVENRDLNGMSDISYGDYDFYIEAWARKAAKVKSPILLRFGHEMNDAYRYPWGVHNNSAAAFIAAWQHVYAIFKTAGATNVIWVYSPHPAYGFFKEFYPGDAYVDYVAVGALNYGTVASWSQWWSFDEIFGKYYPALAEFNKPIMIAELGSLVGGGNRSLWFKNALEALPKRYPAVKAVLFFHYSVDKTVSDKSLNWYFIHDTASKQAVINALKRW
jgi:Glycosyl hydrolase family 26